MPYTIGVPQDKPHYREAYILFHLTDTALAKISLQKDRIELERNKGNMLALFADIHFLLISISNLQQILVRLRRLFKMDIQYMQIYKKYIKQLEHLNIFRDHLEHILDGRIEGKDKKGQPLKNPSMLGNLFNDEYDFGGERFNISDAFVLCTEIERDLKEWNHQSKIYPLWN